MLRSCLKSTAMLLGVVATLQFATFAFAQEDAAEAPKLVVADVFGDHMVLQRERHLPVWGQSEPGASVTAKIAGQEVKTTADDQGNWRLDLKPLSAGGPHELVIASGDETRTIADVLVGEVWVCSGQSNMQWGVNNANDPQGEIAAADHPSIRLFTVPNIVSDKPQQKSDGKWAVCSPETVPGFSAVAYFFGRELQQELDVPIGVINTSWGGSVCEAWTSREALESDPDFAPILERCATNPGAGTGMFNKMIHPLIPFGMRGAIWYQGESNVGRAVQYRKLFPTMIRDWRDRWGQGDFPFYYVQLAPYNYRDANPACAELWEAQLLTLSVPNTGMVVTTDIGNVGDIHPRNKQDVGKRLAGWALSNTYGQEGKVYSGPLFKSATIDGNEVRVEFDHAGSGLAARDDQPLNWFTLAGEDKVFHPAEAKIDGNSVVVTSVAVPRPKSVRFGWDGTAEPNLMNKEGLPASPFRSDSWPAVTKGQN